MAGAYKRTTCGLAAVAIVFIIVIIILCLVPDPCTRENRSPGCRKISTDDSWSDSRHGATQTTTESTTTTASTAARTKPTATTPRQTLSTTEASTSTTEASTSTTEASTSTTEASTSTTMASISTTMASISTTMASILTTMSSTSTTMSSTSTPIAVDVDNTNSTTNVSTTPSATTTSSATTPPTVAATTTTASNTTSSTPTTSTESGGYNESSSSSPTVMSTSTEGTNATLVSDYLTNATLVSDYLTNATTNGSESTTPMSTSSTPVSTNTSTSTPITTLATTNASSTTTAATTTSKTTTETTTQTTTEVTTPEPEKNYCDSPICREVARRMLDIMDPSDVNPCEDFYQYACGGIIDDQFLKPEDPQLLANNIIKEALAKADRNDTELEDLLIVYDSCVSYKSSHNQSQRREFARDVFNELGYGFNPRSILRYKDLYPDLKDEFDLSVALAKMMKFHFTPFFDIMIDVDGDDRSKFQFKMTLPAFRSAFSHDRAKSECLLQYQQSAKSAKRERETFDVNGNYTQYINCTNIGDGLKQRSLNAKNAFRNLKVADFMNDTQARQIETQALSTFEFMTTEISEILPSPPEVRKTLLNKEYELLTVKEMDDNTTFGDTINFEKFFNELLNEEIDPETVQVQVYFKETFQKIFSIIAEYYENPLEMQNMLMLLWLERVNDDLVEPLGPPLASPEYCFNVVTKLMDDYVSYLYLRELPEGGDKLQRQMKDMISLSKELVLSQLEESSLHSKEDFKSKLEDMTGEVASLKNIGDSLTIARDTKMNVSRDNFANNYISLMKDYRMRLYTLKSELPYDSTSMWSQLQLIYKANGVSSYALNKFLIPYAAMSPPLYYEGVPGYINYAGIGHVIAHELMHGFDSTGMKYDSESKNKMEPDFTLINSSECLAGQLAGQQFINSSTGLYPQFTLHRNLALDELLADSAAIQLAWDTYHEDLARQLYPRATKTTTAQPKIGVEDRPNSMHTGDDSRPIEILKSYTSLPDKGLPHFEDFTPVQLYFLKIAQNQCSATSEINLIGVMENEHLPSKLRVNLGVGNNLMFKKAFRCPATPEMIPSEERCPYSPTKTMTAIEEGIPLS